jgi:hypothetical protein
MKPPPKYPFVVCLRLPGKTYWEFEVTASNEKEAVTLALVDAGRQGIPVHECELEVR